MPGREGDWRARAGCARATLAEQIVLTSGPPNHNGAGSYSAHRQTARKFCHDCPVRIDCLNWAWDENHFVGIAGGMFFGFEDRKRNTQDGRRLVDLL